MQTISRTLNARLQSIAALTLKVSAVGASYLTIPLSLSYLGVERFGVWITLFSFAGWFAFLDVGVGSSLKNALANALATGDIQRAREKIMSAVGAVFLIISSAGVLLSVVLITVDWQKVFNTKSPSEDLTFAVGALFAGFLINTALGLASSIWAAVQRYSAVVLGQLLTNGIFLAEVFWLAKNQDSGEIFKIAAAFVMAQLVSGGVILSLLVRARPDLFVGFVPRLKGSRTLLKVGGLFFALQLSNLVFSMTDRIVIAQLIGPAAVAEFEVPFKLFNLLIVAHVLLSAPVWAATSDAFSRGDRIWIAAALQRQRLLFGFLAFFSILMLVLAPYLTNIWIGEKLPFSRPLTLALCVFCIMSCWINTHGPILNGLGKVKEQLKPSFIAMFLNIPLAVLFVRGFGMHAEGVVWASCVSLALLCITSPLTVQMALKEQRK